MSSQQQLSTKELDVIQKQINQLSDIFRIFSNQIFKPASKEKSEGQTNVMTIESFYEIMEHQLLAMSYIESNNAAEDEDEDSIIYCVPCFLANRKAHSVSPELSMADAQRFLNGTASGSLSTGLLISSAELESLLEGGDAFSNFRFSVACHLAGVSDKEHAKVTDKYLTKQASKASLMKPLLALMRAAVFEIRNPHADSPFENLVRFLAASNISVQDIHTNFLELCNLIINSLHSMARESLRQTLPSTGSPPMLNLSCSLRSKSALPVIVLVRRCPVTGRAISTPIDPAKLSKKQEINNEQLATHLLASLTGANAPLVQLISVATDGLYKSADEFADMFRSLLKPLSVNAADICMPIGVDAAHYINQALLDARNGPSGRFLRRFLSRAAKFTHLFVQARQLVKLEKLGVDEAGISWSALSDQFVSSVLHQCDIIANYFGQLFLAYRRQVNSSGFDSCCLEECEMFGCDFVQDLLCLLDLLEPIRALILIATDAQLPHWKVLQLSGSAADYLAKRSGEFLWEHYPRLLKAGDSVQPGGSYSCVPLLPGWVSEPVSLPGWDGPGPGPVEMRLRTTADVQADVTRFAGALRESLSRQLEAYSAAATPTDAAAVMDAGAAVCLLASGDVAAEIEALAESPAAQRLLSAAIKHRGLAHLSSGSVASYVRAIHHAFIGGQGREGWTIPEVTGRISAVLTEPLQLGCDLKTRLKVTTEAGEVVSVVLNEAAIYRSMYNDPRVFVVAGREGCLLLDFALHLGGNQVFVETYYSTMSSQQQQQEQQPMQYSHKLDLAVLRLRTKLCLMLPPAGSYAYESVLDDAAEVFFDKTKREKLRKQIEDLEADWIANIVAREAHWGFQELSDSGI